MGEAVEFAFIMPDQLPIIWPHVEDYIKHALNYDPSEKEVDATLANIQDGKWLLAVAYVGKDIIAAYVMNIQHTLGAKVCSILYAGGKEMDKWLASWMDIWRNIALEQGCSRIVVRGRPGWQRTLKEYGFKPKIVILEADL